jgi:hypothetical protein
MRVQLSYACAAFIYVCSFHMRVQLSYACAAFIYVCSFRMRVQLSYACAAFICVCSFHMRVQLSYTCAALQLSYAFVAFISMCIFCMWLLRRKRQVEYTHTHTHTHTDAPITHELFNHTHVCVRMFVRTTHKSKESASPDLVVAWMVSCRCSAPSCADIYYTIDGKKPSALRPGLLYAGGGVQIRCDTTVHAVAVSLHVYMNSDDCS